MRSFAKELRESLNVAVTELAVTIALPPGATAALLSAFPATSRGDALDVDVGEVTAGDEIDLVFTVRIERGRVGERLPLGVIAAWTDPRADRRCAVNASPDPLRCVREVEVEAAEADRRVAERAARQRAAAARRAGLELDRAGRFAEARLKMRDAQVALMAAPMTDAVRRDLEESAKLAAAAASDAYAAHERKAAQYREELRRRGRFDRSGEGAIRRTAAH